MFTADEIKSDVHRDFYGANDYAVAFVRAPVRFGRVKIRPKYE